MRLILFLFIFLALFFKLHAQQNVSLTNRKLNIRQLKADLLILRDSLQAIHPALYRYRSPAFFDTAFTRAIRNIKHPLTIREFYPVVAGITSKAGDIHTNTELPDEFRDEVAAKNKLFPFDVRIIGNKVFIASNNSRDTTIQPGSILTFINHHPIAEVLEKMKDCFAGEGFNQTFKIRTTEQRFAFQYLFVFGPTPPFTITYNDPNGKQHTRLTSARSFSEIQKRRKENQSRYPKLKPLFSKPPYLNLTISENHISAVMTVKWFQNDVLAGNQEYFKPFVDSAFAELRKKQVKNLIIDIRNNGGGESENASYLYSFLANAPFHFLDSMGAKQKIYERDLARGINYHAEKKQELFITTDSITSAPSFFGIAFQSPRNPAFTGNLIVLVDGLTASAAAQFAALIRTNQRGKLVGEQVPGTLTGGSGRGYSYFLLPNSGLLVMISHYRLFLSVKVNSAEDCIDPDYHPVPTFNELLDGVDRDIEVAEALAQQNSP